MATIATCAFPMSVDVVEHTPLPTPGHFFFPPVAFSFLTNVDDAWATDRVMSPYLLTGALLPEGAYLEPTIGQIWPRIG